MADSETVKLMTTLLGDRWVAKSAVSYLATCREIPSEGTIAKTLRVPMLTAKKIAAAAKISTRFLFGSLTLSLKNPERVAWCLSDIKDKNVENLIVLTLTPGNTLIKRHLCATGSAGGVCVDYGEVYRCAVEDHATGVIVAHNHPSGSLEFSEKDVTFTRGLREAGKILGIRMLDSVVVSRQGFASMRRIYPDVFKDEKQKKSGRRSKSR